MKALRLTLHVVTCLALSLFAFSAVADYPSPKESD
jgi:hypothetical protein